MRERRAEIALLAALMLAALAVRAYGISETSLAEDEASKLAAAREYRQGHFSGVNAEHPMLLKLMIWGSLEVGDRVNRTSPAQPWPQGRVESWLRLPNVILGAATTLLIYLLGLELMGTSAAGMIVGGLGAFFWAFLPIPIALNRVAKEDTPLTFFTVLAVYSYAHAKHAPAARARRWTDATGVAFGLALASKYIFHIFGLNALVWHVAGHQGIDRQPLGKYFWRMTAIMVAVFIVLNPVLLSPHNLLSALGYAEGAEVHHHGYNLDGHIYMNSASLTPYGVPWYFYAWVLAVKTPLAVLALLLAAAVLLLVRDRKSLSSIYFRVMVLIGILCISLMGAKWIRYMLPAVPFVCLGCGYAGQKLYAWISGLRQPAVRWLAMAAGVALVLVWPAAETVQWAPYDSLYLNPLGGGRANVARFFPHDEIYDLGTHQAVAAVLEQAPPGATLAAANPRAVQFYLKEAGRKDVHLVPIYDVSYVPHPGDFLIVQRARRYFETYGLYDLVERAHMPYQDIRDGGYTMARVYCFAACPHAESAAVRPDPAGLGNAAAKRGRGSRNAAGERARTAE